jgi:hypothetical protein
MLRSRVTNWPVGSIADIGIVEYVAVAVEVLAS